MAHKTDQNDVREAFQRFTRLTGFSLSKLYRAEDGYWIDTNSQIIGLGKSHKIALAAIERYCNGFRDGWKAAFNSLDTIRKEDERHKTKAPK